MAFSLVDLHLAAVFDLENQRRVLLLDTDKFDLLSSADNCWKVL
jgi:hypothetical protein